MVRFYGACNGGGFRISDNYQAFDAEFNKMI